MLLASAGQAAKVGMPLGVHRLNLHGTGLGDMGVPIPHVGSFAPGMEQRARDTLHHICDLAEAKGQAIGLAELALTALEARLEGLCVHPGAMRRGAGRALLDWACAEDWGAGQAALAIDADPNAEAFYLSQGAERQGAIPAPLPGQPDRVRPRLRLATAPRDPASP